MLEIAPLLSSVATAISMFPNALGYAAPQDCGARNPLLRMARANLPMVGGFVKEMAHTHRRLPIM